MNKSMLAATPLKLLIGDAAPPFLFGRGHATKQLRHKLTARTRALIGQALLQMPAAGNLRKDRAAEVFWTLTLLFQDGRVEVFASMNHAPEQELRKAFDSLSDACKIQAH